MKGLGSGGSANEHIQQCAEEYFSSITPTPLEKALHFSAGRLFCAMRDSGVGSSHPWARGSKESRNPSLFVGVRIAENQQPGTYVPSTQCPPEGGILVVCQEVGGLESCCPCGTTTGRPLRNSQGGSEKEFSK